ncbi:TPA: hypothetical protein HA281_00075 [Candidatus Woesearchaeota archaeon]|nr:MAG: Type II secretion system protein [archaeon GW2011_AR11]HIH05008.1 hypothetical protein [Candidatus Woesearchaeota archaeon]HIH91179.1 hypothetical protein [Candidatus Woesearchaeota archaeon]HII64760.1 hypothetical protein [Candidatus Woesearchaeota archaeon]HIJ18303.1 hypothetical protein [Candidatus Woesearchaeota archaeon]
MAPALPNPGSSLLKQFPHLQRELRMANMKTPPAQVLNRGIRNGLLYGAGMAVGSFFILSRARMSLFLMLPVFIIFFLLFFMLEPLKVKSAISRRRREIDREVIFIGRYLLIKLYSGRPLLNALTEIAQSRGVTAAYVREIVHDINTGTPIEDALKDAVAYCPSEKFARILFQLNNALKIGVDVTKPLESLLQTLTKGEEIELQRYGKKLNTVVIFYMVAAIVIPSLGISLFMVITSFINLPMTLNGLLAISFFVVVLQFIFISLFRGIRPNIDL